MSARTCMVTGANAGIGFETARQLAQAGNRVIMACRDEGRGAEAADQVRRDSDNGDVHLLLCDLASLASVRKAVSEFHSRFDRLHVLVNNAALYTNKREITDGGFERQIAVNYLGPFLLTNLSLDALVASAPARIINMPTVNHFNVSLDLDDLQSAAKYDPRTVHFRSKLAVILFTYELARRLAGTGVTANALHPGVIATTLLAKVRRIPPAVRSRDGLGSDVGSLEDGARTPVYLATSGEVAGVSGRFFDNCEPVASSAESCDRDKAERLWAVSAKLTGLEQIQSSD